MKPQRRKSRAPRLPSARAPQVTRTVLTTDQAEELEELWTEYGHPSGSNDSKHNRSPLDGLLESPKSWQQVRGETVTRSQKGGASQSRRREKVKPYGTLIAPTNCAFLGAIYGERPIESVMFSMHLLLGLLIAAGIMYVVFPPHFKV